ncbi:MAG: DUF1499 domain-containing protein [Pseudomonadota bacterium]
MRLFLIVLCLAGVGVLAYIRLAPGDPERWHVAIDASSDADFDGGAIRVLGASPDDFATADAALRTLPRTRVLAGSLEDGRITYVTRSLAFGFPDYTTLQHSDGTLKAHARLRFGRSDFGVNRERLEQVLGAVQGR